MECWDYHNDQARIIEVCLADAFPSISHATAAAATTLREARGRLR